MNCEIERCDQTAMVGVGPKPDWLCLPHFQEMLEMIGRRVRVVIGHIRDEEE